MDDEAYDSDEPAPTLRWHSTVTWSGLLLAGLLLYELTSQPALGTAALCLKFGWEDFKTARWLWRFDPWRARGSACWWMYCGWGLLKASAAATAAILLLGVVVLTKVLLAQQILDTDWLVRASIGAGVATFAGASIIFLTAFWTLIVARRHRLKLWLHSSISDSRRRNVWPPRGPVGPPPGVPCDAAPLSQNRLPLFLGLPVLFLWLIPPAVLIVWLENLLSPTLLLICTPLIGIPYSRTPFTRLAERMLQPVTAQSPAECWPPDELAAAADDPVQ